MGGFPIISLEVFHLILWKVEAQRSVICRNHFSESSIFRILDDLTRPQPAPPYPGGALLVDALSVFLFPWPLVFVSVEIS